jgi:hypothetical protein
LRKGGQQERKEFLEWQHYLLQKVGFHLQLQQVNHQDDPNVTEGTLMIKEKCSDVHNITDIKNVKDFVRVDFVIFFTNATFRRFVKSDQLSKILSIDVSEMLFNRNCPF